MGGRYADPVALEILPAVHLDQGGFPELPGEEVDAALTRLARRFGRVVVVDVAGIKRNQPELEQLQHTSKRRALWWDAGSRFATDAMDLFIAGAESVTLRWNTLQNAKELEEVASLCDPATIHLALEYPRGTFLPHSKDRIPAADVARLADRLGMSVVYVVDRSDTSFLRTLPAVTGTRHVQGPVSAVIGELEALGFTGAIVPADRLPAEERATE